MDATTLIIYIVMFAVLIVLTIIPQKRRQKKQKEILDSLALGTTVVTIGGIRGKIVALRDEYVTIETGTKGMEMDLLRQAISTVKESLPSEITAE